MKPPRPYECWRTDEYRRWCDAFDSFGHLLMTHARDEALRKSVPESSSDETRKIAETAVIAALYGVMEILGGFAIEPGEDYCVEYALLARVRETLEEDEVWIEQIEVAPNGHDDIYMGFHRWEDGEFEA